MRTTINLCNLSVSITSSALGVLYTMGLTHILLCYITHYSRITIIFILKRMLYIIWVLRVRGIHWEIVACIV